MAESMIDLAEDIKWIADGTQKESEQCLDVEYIIIPTFKIYRF